MTTINPITINASNYLRHAWVDIDEQREATTHVEHTNYRNLVEVVLAKSPSATKFSMPSSGSARPGQNGASVSPDELHLPFPTVILESRVIAGLPSVLWLEEEDTSIFINIALRQKQNRWCLLPIDIRLTGFENRIMAEYRWLSCPVEVAKFLRDKPDAIKPIVGLAIGSVLSFIEAVSSKNTVAEKLQIPKTTKAISQGRALPFDQYHTLVICRKNENSTQSDQTSLCETSQRRQSREHTRRGTMCYGRSGAKWWRRSTVVNHGVGGKIIKNYEVKR